MTIEEVKIGLRCCTEEKCGQCPYRMTRRGCIETLIRDAGKTIRMLEEENKGKQEERT